jgi:hypothetical protein
MRRQEELGLREVFAGEEQLFAHLWKRGLGVGTAVRASNRKGCKEKLAKDAKAMNLVWKVFGYASYVVLPSAILFCGDAVVFLLYSHYGDFGKTFLEGGGF